MAELTPEQEEIKFMLLAFLESDEGKQWARDLVEQFKQEA